MRNEKVKIRRYLSKTTYLLKLKVDEIKAKIIVKLSKICSAKDPE